MINPCRGAPKRCRWCGEKLDTQTIGWEDACWPCFSDLHQVPVLYYNTLQGLPEVEWPEVRRMMKERAVESMASRHEREQRNLDEVFLEIEALVKEEKIS